MPIYKGSTEITSGNLKLGNKDVKEVYLGSQLIWPSKNPFTYTVLDNKTKDNALGDYDPARVETIKERVKGRASLPSNKEWRALILNLSSAKAEDLLVVMLSYEEVGLQEPGKNWYSGADIPFRIINQSGTETKHQPSVFETWLDGNTKVETSGSNKGFIYADYGSRGCRSEILALPVGSLAGQSNVSIRWASYNTDPPRDDGTAYGGTTDGRGAAWRRHQMSAVLVHEAASANLEYKKALTSSVSGSNSNADKEVVNTFSSVKEDDLILSAPMYAISTSWAKANCSFTTNNGTKEVLKGLGKDYTTQTSFWGDSDHLILSGLNQSSAQIKYTGQVAAGRRAAMCSLRIYR